MVCGGLGVDPDHLLAGQDRDATLGAVHQLRDRGVERWRLKIQTSFSTIPLLKPEVLHGVLVAHEPELLGEGWPHVRQPVLVPHYENPGEGVPAHHRRLREILGI